MHITEWIIQYGYLIIFVIMFLEMIVPFGIFVPGGSTFLALTGYLTAISSLNFFVCALLAFLGTVLGNHISYEIGKKGGKHFVDKLKHKFFEEKHIDKTQKFFDKHGKKTVLFARFVFFIRNTHALFIGTMNMLRKEFITFNVIGAAIWVLVVMSVGWTIGLLTKNIWSYDQVKDVVDKILLGFTIISFLSIFSAIFYRLITKKK